jgi:hypothetical protein
MSRFSSVFYQWHLEFPERIGFFLFFDQGNYGYQEEDKEQCIYLLLASIFK